MLFRSAKAAPPSLRIASIVGAVLGYIFYFAGKAGGFLVGGLSGIAWQGLGGLVLALGIERTASAVSDRRYAQAVKWSGIFLAGALPPLAAGLLDRLSVGGLILCLCQGCLMAGACWLNDGASSCVPPPQYTVSFPSGATNAA